MTGGFNTQIRGIEIDVVKTLNHFLKQNKKQYSIKEFEDYLTKINLTNDFKHDTGQKKPLNDGFVVSFEFDEMNDNQEAYSILATGLWEYQNWVTQEWSQKDLEEQKEFNNPKHLSRKIELRLKDLWKDKLILKGKFVIRSIGCEWSHSFFKKKGIQKGGNFNNNYYYKYLKYKYKNNIYL
jgi:hypothetical protein